MAEILTKKEAIDELVKQAKKLDKLEIQILLTKLRVNKMAKDGVKPAAKPPKGLKMPSMRQINRWTHESRKLHAGK
jgi:hypothetical protein